MISSIEAQFGCAPSTLALAEFLTPDDLVDDDRDGDGAYCGGDPGTGRPQLAYDHRPDGWQERQRRCRDCGRTLPVWRAFDRISSSPQSRLGLHCMRCGYGQRLHRALSAALDSAIALTLWGDPRCELAGMDPMCRRFRRRFPEQWLLIDRPTAEQALRHACYMRRRGLVQDVMDAATYGPRLERNRR